MQKIVQKNFKQREIFKINEKKKIILKCIYNNFFFDKSIRIKNKKKFFLFNTNSSITRIKNRCIITGRAGRVFKRFKLTRHVFKQLASKKFLPGLVKYNW